MDEPRRRTPKKPEHPIREWISDYLRYFMLIGGILLILLVVFLVVRLISGGTGSSSSVTESTAAVSVEETSDQPDDTGDGAAAVSESAADAENTEAAEETAEDEEAASAVMTREADESVIAILVKNYFAGLSARDPEAVRACVDTLSDEDYQQIAENTQITSYSDVEVYTFDGVESTSRVVFVSYSYTVSGSDAVIPALTQFYAYDTGDGDWRLASDTGEEAVQQRMEEMLQTDAVQNMIAEVQEQYDQVVAAHSELQ